MNERRAKAAPTAPSLPKNRAVVISTTAIGTALLLVTVWLLLVAMPERLEAERAFRAAKDCAPGTAATECLHSVPAVIERTREKTGKTPAHWMYVKTSEGNTPTLYFKGDQRYTFDGLAGKRIHVTYWEGSVRYIDWADARWYTAADPRGAYRLFFAWGLALGTAGLGLMLIGLWWVRGYATTRLRHPWQPGVVIAGAAVLAPMGVLFTWTTHNWRTALCAYGLAGAVVIAGCALAAVRLHRADARRSTDSIVVQPIVPEEEAVFAASVRGDVPYGGVVGGGFVIAEAGRLSIIPDPNYRLHPRVVPGTLEPLRVRPPYRTDPFDVGDTALILECRDGDTPVYIAAARENMPLLLGALTSSHQLAQG
uniref:Integral membrane protein n=1 Tax=Streptomyces sp. NBC_00003 TaxID=2903608 RepID=A0AAU2V475_9ACTN